MSGVELKNCSYLIGQQSIFKDIDLEIPKGEITVILGPSGCGKTSMLRCIAGLAEISQGKITNPFEASMSFVFQEPRLLPWYRVSENLDINLKGHTPDKTERRKLVNDWLEKTGLSGKENSYPEELSGGMKFRLSLARAFSRDCRLLLLDEPMQGQDINTKQTLIHLIRNIWSEHKTTAIYVTHDTREAVLLGQRIVIMSSAPARVVKVIENPGASEISSLADPRALEMETQLYKLLLGAS
ncbi:ATP-binding cassette domain-containing protein [Vibrio sp. JC009]|uniref:ABC transporter ATP-binding protein n=1 Tax=Vibrio sp. JC009 TaxID=2912314 RepID=UPI0023B0F97D|nr:ATP-binding cassette domain-containing protein [Vibrio sp. JC009]WED22927.1 ATP-binding cassette domain-containing protein [Vibrio sp. JC009]